MFGMLICGQTMLAVSRQEQMLQAHEAYKAGNFEQAQTLYEQFLDKSPGLYYNLGNCLYKQGKLGNALAYWRKAEMNWGLTGRHDLLDNIALVKQKLQEKRPTTQPSPAGRCENIKTTFASLLRSISMFWLQITCLLFWIFLLLALTFWSRLRSKMIIASVASLWIGASMLMAAKYRLRSSPRCVVIAQQAALLSGPGSPDEYRQLGTVYEGEEGQVERTSSGYMKVVFNKQRGWIKQSMISVV